MIHFSTMIIGADPEKALAPFHEFECTGVDDEFVKDVDLLPETRAEYENGSSRRLVDESGNVHEPWADRFWREPNSEERQNLLGGAGVGATFGFSGGVAYRTKDWGDGRGRRTKVQFIPEGFVEREIPYKELMSFAEYVEYKTEKMPLVLERGRPLQIGAEQKYGYWVIEGDPNDLKSARVVQVIDRTNPNAKWDWWVVGGRWSGHLKLKTGERADSALFSAIDLDGMREEAGAKAELDWRIVHAMVPSLSKFVSFNEFIKRHDGDHDAARKAYHSQPAMLEKAAATKDPQLTADEQSMMTWCDLGEFMDSMEEHGAKARRGALATFAVVKDGCWYERGKMGWWGAVSDEKDADTWNEKFSELLDGIEGDTLITVVDCHI